MNHNWSPYGRCGWFITGQTRMRYLPQVCYYAGIDATDAGFTNQSLAPHSPGCTGLPALFSTGRRPSRPSTPVRLRASAMRRLLVETSLWSDQPAKWRTRVAAVGNLSRPADSRHRTLWSRWRPSLFCASCNAPLALVNKLWMCGPRKRCSG